MEFGISAFLCPKVERDGSELVHQRLRKAVFCKVNRLDVGLARIAALDADMRKGFSGVDRKLRVVLLAASRAYDASKFPLSQTESAQQVASARVSLLAKHSQHGLPIAERALRIGVALKLQPELGADKLGIRLQKGKREEFFGARGRLAGGGPDCVQKIGPRTGGRSMQLARDLRELVRTVLLNNLKKARPCRVSILPARKWAGCPLFPMLAARRDRSATGFTCAISPNPQMKILLEAGQVPVEAQNLTRKGILGGESFGAPDALLAGSVGHRAIMGLRAGS